MSEGDINGFVALDIPSRWRYVVNKAAADYPSAAHDKFHSICTAFGGYTEFGIVPAFFSYLVAKRR